MCYNIRMNDFLLDNVKKIDARILEGDFPNVTDFIGILKVNERTVRRY